MPRAGGVHLGLSNGGAQTAAATVTVSTTAQLESAVKNAAAGTVIQVRGGTCYPNATLILKCVVALASCGHHR